MINLFHPLPLFLASHLVSTLTAGFTTPSSLPRYLGLFVCLSITVFSFNIFPATIESTGWCGRCLAGAAFSSPLVVFDRLIYRKWAYGKTWLGPKVVIGAGEDHKDGDSAKRKRELEMRKQSRFAFGGEVAGSTRCVESEEEVNGVPWFNEDDHDYVPSQAVFLARQAVFAIALNYLNIFAIDLQPSSNSAHFLDSRVPFLTRIGDVGIQELLTRVRISIAYWVAQYCILQSFASLFAFLAVLVDPDEIPLWRPLFGSLGKACTVRGFWGKFWHQNIQLNLKGPADFMTYKVLQLPSGTLLTRYTKILLAFAVSGIMHVFADFGGGVPLLESGAMRFFCTQALGIVLEDGAQELWRRMFGENKIAGNWRERSEKVLGYVWVVAFLSWSSPVWVYPVARKMAREDMLLNLKAVKPLIDHLFM